MDAVNPNPTLDPSLSPGDESHPNVTWKASAAQVYHRHNNQLSTLLLYSGVQLMELLMSHLPHGTEILQRRLVIPEFFDVALRGDAR